MGKKHVDASGGEEFNPARAPPNERRPHGASEGVGREGMKALRENTERDGTGPGARTVRLVDGTKGVGEKNSDLDWKSLACQSNPHSQQQKRQMPANGARQELSRAHGIWGLKCG